jgi:hypothetical protein
MKRALLLLLLSASRVVASDSWPSVSFATVRAYAWREDQGGLSLIRPGMKLAPGVINREGALLNGDQTHRLRVAVSREPPSRGGIQKIPVFNCYWPHNAFVFYNAAKRPVAYLELCFSCLGNRAQPPIPSPFPNYLSLATIFEELKLPMGPYKTAEAFKKARLGQ